MSRAGWLVAFVVLGACGGSGAPEPADPDTVMQRGETLSLACRACHSLEPGGVHMIGPNLNGVFGRRAGSLPDFGGYSEAMRRSGLVWTPELVDQWLAKPFDFMPGTTMVFAGYQSAEDRSALIAYLMAATEPEPEPDSASEPGPGD